MKAYLLKESLDRLWNYRYPGRCQDFCVNGFRFLFLSLFSFQ